MVLAILVLFMTLSLINFGKGLKDKSKLIGYIQELYVLHNYYASLVECQSYNYNVSQRTIPAYESRLEHVLMIEGINQSFSSCPTVNAEFYVN